MNTLGSIIVALPDEYVSKTCKVGTGYDAATRQLIWDNRDNYLGKLAKVKHFEVGSKDSLRFPVYLGIRHEDDI